MLEAGQYSDNAFVTLTYDDAKLPAGGSLCPPDVQRWMKVLRRRVSPHKFRFFLVGEYGDQTGRPHYHAALFNFPGCRFGQSIYSDRRASCCSSCDLVRETWGKGNVSLGVLEADSAGYICGYVTKKMTSVDDWRLEGRHPEFARMSLVPGIGRDACWEIADVLLRYNLDPCTSLRHGSKVLPLGRYLSKAVRKFVGRDEKLSQAELDAVFSEVRSLQLVARNDSENPSLRSQILKVNEGKFQSFESRRRLYKKGRSL